MLLSLLLGCASHAPPIVADPQHPRVIALDEAEVRAGPGPEHPARFTLAAGALGATMAVGTAWSPGEADEAVGYRWLLVDTPQGQGWVFGEHVAVEVDHSEPAWPGRPLAARTVDEVPLWSALREGREYEPKWESWERPVVHGWLVLERPSGPERIEVASSNGWGTSLRTEQVAWRDITGDGHDEAILVQHETVTEAGSVGHTVVFWDLTRAPLEPLASLPVHDPHWSGLATTDRYGWVDLWLDERRLLRTTVVAEPCAGPPAETACPVIERWAWSWTEGRIVEGEVERAPLQATVAAGPLYADPELEARAGELAAQAVCVDRTRWPIGIGDVFRARVGPCGGEPLGWVPSGRLDYPLPLLDEILGPWPEEASEYVRFEWHRD